MIDELVDDLKTRASMLAKVARRMRSKGVPSVEVMNYLMAQRGQESLRKFYLTCLKEVGGE
jgi:hypothetical protein